MNEELNEETFQLLREFATEYHANPTNLIVKLLHLLHERLEALENTILDRCTRCGTHAPEREHSC